MKHPGIRVIGLTGGIATGKSTIASLFSGQGVTVIDADRLSRDAVLPGSQGLKRIIEEFGSDILSPDGELDRSRLGALVFSDKQKRSVLESILHPEIRRLAEKQISAAAERGEQVLVYMSPLLIEARALDRVDELWVVTVRPEIQLLRLMERDRIDPDEAARIIAAQMPLPEKEKYGRIVIDNSGTIEETGMKFAEIWKQEAEKTHG